MQSHEEIRNKLAVFITENYIDIVPKKQGFPQSLILEESETFRKVRALSDEGDGSYSQNIGREEPEKLMLLAERAAGIDDFLQESFEEDGVAKRLNLYMYERDITTAMIYKRCFVDRRLISKITGGTNYHPSKNTMLALCIGLQLNLQEGEEFLLLAGYSFSSSSKYDLIIKFLLQNEIYDLDTINEMLYQYEQPCLGA
ncbi:MAG: hypothetical protein HDQ96_04535 [Lachnospiraceae bacterium]|nr:hypothetical protein [Lachnospiraceae bacterium]